ncbi:putative methyltransferase-domain-containing protein [Obelidium mucronatum]|nr:putative methyltransferase-domain-containing protein [Obelidium mucronatum]
MTLAYSYTLNTGDTIAVQQDPDILGATVWDACLVLAKYLEAQLAHLVETGFNGRGTRAQTSKPSNHDSNHDSNNNSATKSAVRIVELGAGCGLLGLVAGALLPAAAVVVTDTARVLPILAANAALAAHANVAAKELEWSRSQSQSLDFDLRPANVVLVSDCVYDKACFAPLNNTLLALCEGNPNTLVIMAYERRNFDSEVSFFKLFGEKFRFRHVPPEELDPRFSAPEEIYVFLAKLRVDKEDF